MPADVSKLQRTLAACARLAAQPDKRLDDLVQLAARLCDCPVAFIALVDGSRTRVVAATGWNEESPPTDLTLGVALSGGTGPLVLHDLGTRPSAAGDDPEPPQAEFRFAAVVPLRLGSGETLGWLAALDRRPRVLPTDQHEALTVVARAAMVELELYRVVQDTPVAAGFFESSPAGGQGPADPEEFARALTHELRSPAGQMRGLAGLLQDASAWLLHPEERGYLSSITELADQMCQTITALHGLTHLPRHVLEWRAVPVAELVRQTAQELLFARRSRDVEITFGDLPDCQGDPTLLRIVFSNLLRNAMKFTRHRARALIHVGGRLQGGEVVYYVQDNGVGFDMRHADKLFKAFGRLHDARDFEGAGIGLSLVHRIVLRHRGLVWAEAELNQGATFCFSLPRDPVSM
jgi:signal transduction histidine kinase